MDPHSHTRPRRSRRQQGRCPESDSIPNYSLDSHPNPTNLRPPNTPPQPYLHRGPAFPSTMSHDRAPFIPRQHDMAPSSRVYDTTHAPTLPHLAHPLPTQPAQPSPPTHDVLHPHDALRPPSAANATNPSTTSIINNAENILQEGNALYLRHTQGGHNSHTSTDLGSSLTPQVLPPLQHIHIPQPHFYPPAFQPPSQQHMPPSLHAPPTQDHRLLTQFLADNHKMQETLVAHISNSNDLFNRLFQQNENLQRKLNQSIELTEKLSAQLRHLTVHTIPQSNLPNTTAPPQIDLLDVNSPLVPTTSPVPTVENVPRPPHLVPPPAVTTQQEHTALLERLIKISEAQVLLHTHKKDARNTKFPIFNGDDINEFTSWYNNILSILASTGWNELYNSGEDRPITETTAQQDPKLTSLSADLYSYLHVAMKKDAQTLMEDKTELRGKGLLFLQTLYQTYNVKLASGELMATEKAYANIFRRKDEKISTFASRCKKLRNILKLNGIESPLEGLKLRFIMGLGPDFSDIQKNLHNLPPDWQTTDMNQLTIVATSYLNSVKSIRTNNEWYKSQNSTSHPNTDSKNVKSKQAKSPNKPSSKDDNATRFQAKNSERQSRILRDIRDGTFSAKKYSTEVPNGACIWHGTVHKIPQCTVLHNLLNPTISTTTLKPPSYAPSPLKAKLATLSSTPSPTPTPPPMEDVNIVDFDAFDQASPSSNDKANTSNTSQPYSHYIQPLTCSATVPNRNPTQPQPFLTPTSHRFIIDSGAFPHMCNSPQLFTKINPWTSKKNPHVTLADGTTTSKIEGMGTIQFSINHNTVTLHNVLLVPTLSHSLFSVKQHCHSPGNYFHSESGTATLAFPTFIHSVPIEDDIYMDVIPLPQLHSNTMLHPTATDNIDQVPRNKTSPMAPYKATKITSSTGDLPGLDIPIVPQPASQQKVLPHWITNKRSKVTVKFPGSNTFVLATTTGDPHQIILQLLNSNTKTALSTQQATEMIRDKHLLQGHHHHVSAHPDTYQIGSSRKFAPLRVIDKALPSQTSNKSYTLNQIQQAFGFRNVSSIIKQIEATNKNCLISTLDIEPIIDLGQVASIDKPKRNTTKLPLPPQRGDVVHMDIIYGAGSSIDGIKYALFIVDRATRYKIMLPIRNLKTDVLPNLKKFCSIMGTTPKYLRTDFDHKLIGRHIQQFIEENDGIIESAPPKLQNQNGVCERNWRTLLKMARNWLASSLLPSTFWWHAIKRASQMANYIPLKLNNKLTTPHELVFGVQPDFQNILPMFSVAYVDYKDVHTLKTQTVKAILLGRSDISHALEFYHPHTKRVLTSAIFRLDETLTAGPSFGLPYDGGFYFHKFVDTSTQYIAPTFEPKEKVFVNTPLGDTTGTILTIPLQNDNIYTIQLNDGSMHQYLERDIRKISTPTTVDPPLNTIPKWLQHLSKCTLFLNTMDKPKHGYLVQQNNQHFFRPGHKTTNTLIPLPHFDSQALHLIHTHQLFKGHPHFTKLIQAKQNYFLSNTVAKHVSTAGLTSTDVPTLLQHKNLTPGDKKIWDAAYEEEYFGLKNLPAWSVITESEFKNMRHIYKTALPTMAISTIKYNELGHPTRAKYRIVALGNLDPHEWSRSDCYAPVMSLLELRLITALAVRHKRILKSGDVKQAFVQATLPPEENYVLKPPPGCYLTPPNTYWLLKRTLYGLKRSPRHWYERAVQILTQVGLTQCKHSPCLFRGEIIDGQPPLYLGLYVDDFVYFSVSDAVERKFENKLKSLTKVEFMGHVSHFLGIRYQWRQKDGDVKVHMSQEAFADQLIEHAGLSHDSATTNPTPYRSGYPVDAIKSSPDDLPYKQTLEKQLRSYVGSLVWLSQGTRPDLATITNILAKYQNNPGYGHIAAAKYVIKYIKGTKSHGIVFDSRKNISMTSFLHFPLDPTKLYGICDANWGPQDQSRPNPNKQYDDLPLFKTRSISGHFIVLHGPLHWMSKRQKTTARSSAEAEIYSTDACVKDLLQIRLILKDFKLDKQIIKDKISIFNDNMACVQWSKNKTTKGLRHVQIKENGVRENKHLIEIKHCDGASNLADMMSKEDKQTTHFIKLRDQSVPPPFTANAALGYSNPKVKFSVQVSIQQFSPHRKPSTIQQWIPTNPLYYTTNSPPLGSS